MNILKERALWIVLFLGIMGGISYMVVIDTERVNQMENIVERDDDRIGDITKVTELYDRLDLKLNGTKQHLKNLYDTNFFGHINLIQKVVPNMRKNMSGLIINITSIAGYLGLPFQSIYCASKASLNLLGESLNMELKNFNVKIVNLAPGDYKTEIIDNRRDSILDNNSPYNPEYSSFTKAITRGMSKKGNDPREIADMVFKIINSKNPKIHYLSGKFIQKLVTLKEFIPDMIFEKIVMKMYKLK